MLELYVWGSAFNLPSIDPFCLQTIVYLVLSNAEYKLCTGNNPALSPIGELPMLRDGEEYIAGTGNIIRYLEKKGYDLNAKLNKQEKASCLAYSSVLDTTVYDSQLYAWYAEPENFIKVIRPTYAKLLPLSVRYIAPMRMRNHARARLEKYGIVLQDENDKEKQKRKAPSTTTVGHQHLQNEKEGPLKPRSILEELEPEVFGISRSAYAALSHKLGANDFFYGSEPTTLDAIAFGHLALHLFPTLPRNDLSNQLSIRHPNLARFCERMRSLLLTIDQSTFDPSVVPSPPSTPTPFNTSTALSPIKNFFASSRAYVFHTLGFSTGRSGANPPKKVKSPAEIDFERKRWMSVVGGIFVVVGYVIATGMVSIEFGDGEKNEREEETNLLDDEEGWYQDGDDDEEAE